MTRPDLVIKGVGEGACLCCQCRWLRQVVERTLTGLSCICSPPRRPHPHPRPRTALSIGQSASFTSPCLLRKSLSFPKHVFFLGRNFAILGKKADLSIQPKVEIEQLLFVKGRTQLYERAGKRQTWYYSFLKG